MLNSYAKSAFPVPRAQKLIRRPVIALVQYALLAHGAYAADSVTIQLSGEISPRCELSSPATVVELGSLNAGGEREFQFDLHCNDTFAYQLTSRHGGLSHSDAAMTANAPFVSLLPYTVDITIPSDDGAMVEQCESGQLQAGVQGCGAKASGGSAATNKTGSLIIRWDSGSTPIAGTYRDVLSLTLQPVL
jgi:spore coat protein U-like protein